MSVAMTESTEAVDIIAESPHIGITNDSDYRVIFNRISLRAVTNVCHWNGFWDYPCG